tara:strand:+ start:122 stop:592 length:471 start_codon:yes stop_codon:yes gene_type:complete
MAEDIALLSSQTYESNIASQDHVGDTISFDRFQQAVIHINSDSSVNVTFQIWQSTESTITKADVTSGTNCKQIEDKEIVFADPPFDYGQSHIGIINMKSIELDNENGFKYWTWYFNEVGIGINKLSINVVGGAARYSPAAAMVTSPTNVANATIRK